MLLQQRSPIRRDLGVVRDVRPARQAFYVDSCEYIALTVAVRAIPVSVRGPG